MENQNNNNIELYLLKFLFSFENYNKYSQFIHKTFLKDNAPELHRLFTAQSSWFQKFNKDIGSLDDFRLFYNTLFPPISDQETHISETLFANILRIQVEDSIAHDFLAEHIKRAKATEISLLALEVSQGRKTFDVLQSEVEKLNEINLPQEETNEFVQVSEDGTFPDEGYRWRLACLNHSLGSLRLGNFGFLFARPEAGKTTFGLSESVYMAEQSDGLVLYLNNEQPGELIYLRAVQALLGINQETLFKYKKQALKKFRERTKGNFQVYDQAFMRRNSIEKLCKRYSPRLLVVDQLDKIKGFQDDRYDLEMKYVYQWARELSKEYGPVIGLCQAGGTAEGKKWLTMDDVDSSKTSKQGEADWILGIGKSNQEGLESIRHFNISKNKLLGDTDTDPSLRHGKFDVKINPNICRFEDL